MGKGIEERQRWRGVPFILGIGVLFLLIVVVTTQGVASISIIDSLKVIGGELPIVNRLFFWGEIDSTHRTIVWNIRLPRTLLAGLVGVNLAVVGATLQGMFKNPMADPYVLGVSSGAALGATIAIVLGLDRLLWGIRSIQLFAFVGALSTVWLVYTIGRVGKRVSTLTLLLGGIAISSMLSSLISVLMIFNHHRIDKIVMWIMGSVAAASWHQVGAVVPVTLVGTIIIRLYARDLNLFLTGDETAQTLGVDVDRVKTILLVVSSLMIAFTVSVSGVIGFVGLIVPHGARMVVGPDHRVLLPYSALGGGMFMIVADTLARTAIPPTEIPVGAVTAIFGSPYFIYLLAKNKKKVV